MNSERTIWQLDRGTWSEIPDFLGDYYDLGPALTAAGFARQYRIGEEDGSCVAMHARQNGSPPFLIILYGLARYWVLAAATLPDALDLMAKYGPVVMAESMIDAVVTAG